MTDIHTSVYQYGHVNARPVFYVNCPHPIAFPTAKPEFSDRKNLRQITDIGFNFFEIQSYTSKLLFNNILSLHQLTVSLDKIHCASQAQKSQNLNADMMNNDPRHRQTKMK
jgi:hypothetical protein